MYREDFRICLDSAGSLQTALPQSEPIELSSVWRIPSIDQADAVLSGLEPGYAYRRDGHPNADRLASQLAELHRAESAVLTAQGMSAIAASCLTFLRPGDRILLAQPLYGKTSALANRCLQDFGIVLLELEATDSQSWELALQSQPRMAIVETISNPMLSVPDLALIAELCRASSTLLLVDNTFASPLICRPLELGAGLVMESLTKVISGHADAMLGMVCGDRALIDPIRNMVSLLGMASSPLDCWLTRRGMATLPIRLKQSCENAQRLATMLESNECVDAIRYPGLISHPQHQIAKQQFGEQFGSMLSFDLKGGAAQVKNFILELANDIPFCPSLGDVQTTISHPASTSHRALTNEQQAKLGISFQTIRVSVGIEDADWLVQRFRIAIERSQNRNHL